MRLLLNIIIVTVGSIGNLAVVLCIILYIFAIIGLQLFSGTYLAYEFSPDAPPRWLAFVCLFIIYIYIYIYIIIYLCLC